MAERWIILKTDRTRAGNRIRAYGDGRKQTSQWAGKPGPIEFATADEARAKAEALARSGRESRPTCWAIAEIDGPGYEPIAVREDLAIDAGGPESGV